MKIVLINGSNHKGSTYNIGKMLADKIGGNIREFFLPRDFDKFCTGCTNCFKENENRCPHYDKLKVITEAMDKADLLILTSPVYVYHATGAMKAFLDHYGYRWMVHRPNEDMFKKQAVCISTAAGSGMKSTNKDMSDSLFFWGVGKIYKYGVAVRETSFNRVDKKIKNKIDKKTTSLARKIKLSYEKVKPNIKTKSFFLIMRMMMQKGWNEADVKYWESKGWLNNKRPWK